MTVASERGVAKAWDKDGSAYWLDRDDYARLKIAFMAGSAFITCLDVYGDEIVIKLGAIVAVGLTSPTGHDAAVADKKEAAANEALA